MKKIVLVLIIGMVFISGCAEEKKISSIIEDINNKQLGSGIYYEYSNEETKDINAELILKNLIKKNILIEEAWYKGYSSSCCPPNTNRCMEAIVEPVFLIKLKEETELENFVKVDEPEIGWCAYTIAHYKIK